MSRSRFDPLVVVLPVLLLVAAELSAPAPAAGQAADTALAAGAESPGQQTVRVFLDCPRWLCDFDYFRRQTGYVSWVRDRKVADIQVLVTRQGTGGGGQRITLDLIGRRQFEGEDRSFSYTAGPTETDAETRRNLLRVLELGLAGYLVRTDLASRLSLEYSGEDVGATGGAERAREEDPWNLWVFEVGFGGGFDRGGRSKRYDLDGFVSANRTTREWKIDVGLRGEYSESEFEIGEDSTFTSIQQEYGAQTVVVNSIGSHWAAGGQLTARHSTERNQDVMTSVGPAVEYNLFPYSESNRRQLTVLYTVGPEIFEFDQVTVFDQRSNQRFSHALDISLDVEETWGELGLSVRGSHFLDNVQQNRLSVSGNGELELVQGLSFNVFANASRIRDQIYLPREEATREEILVGDREFATDFEYNVNVGLSYTFGSIFSGVVNERFDNLGNGN